ncbi:MAG TPA: hypothetical protein VJS92_14125 [Candidatus Polarisedimenticolaceae bacterium]|nr:hypothetical protein [Candidatus Polarisedimenticolaceae bacterium]
MTDWKSSLRADPTGWLLETACAAIRYRVRVELLETAGEDPALLQARQDALAYAPALQLQRKQRRDGTWGGVIHAGDARKQQTSTEHALYRLFEYGWSRDTRPVKLGAQLLRSYLTAKKDLKFHEFAKAVKADERRERYYRWFLRVLALGMLVRAGYLDDRSRLAVLELLEYTAGFVDDPVSRAPTEEIGASHPLIRREAWKNGYPFLPDLHLARVFAYSPWLLDGELAKMRLKKVFDYVLSPTYQQIAPGLGLVRTAKGSFPKSGGMRLHPVEYYQRHGNLDELLVYLELFARLGLINRYPLLMSYMEWLQSLQGKDGKWNLSTKLLADNSRWTTLLRLEKDWRSPARKEADLTFRMLLLIKYQWERQMRMLDRRDDSYPV